MKKKLYILLTIYLISNSLVGQSVSETFVYAQKLFNDKNYTQSGYYFQRVLVFGNAAYKWESSVYLAEVFFKTKAYDKAYAAYNYLVYKAVEDSVKLNFKYKRLQCLLLSKKYKLAEVELLDIKSTVIGADTLKYYFYYGVLHFLTASYDSAYIGFEKVLQIKNPDSIFVLHQLITEISSFEKNYKRKARLKSMLIPGWGQWYTGNKQPAVNSFLLLGALGTAFIVTGFNYGFLDASVWILPWGYRYYSSGYKLAGQMALHNIEKQRYLVYNRIIQLMQNSYSVY